MSPRTTMTLTPRELHLVITALVESAQDREDWDEADIAAEFTTLHHKFAKAQDSLVIPQEQP